MLFSTFEFCFIFLPITLVIYFMLSKQNIVQQLFLIFASFVFYSFLNYRYFLILILSISINYFVAYIMDRTKSIIISRKTLFYIGVLFNIILLGYYKYMNFFITNINHAFNTDIFVSQIMLPLGISFFTFQQLCFLLDVYKKRQKIGNFREYMQFVSFFPQLISGPIVQYNETVPQFRDNKNKEVNYDNLSKGMYIFAIGLFKKIMIADSLALIANKGFALEQFGFISAWITALAYTFQIYFDFSGYTDMARGVAKMLNIDLPINFDSPYKSVSIKDFWNRWHMTLGRVLKKCIYVPLGGNKKGIYRMFLAIFITFAASGLWHGASWNFVLWGMFYGIILIIENIFSKIINRVPVALRCTKTFVIVLLLWVLFRADSLQVAIKLYEGLISVANMDISVALSLASDFAVGNKSQAIMIAILFMTSFIIVFCTRNSNELEKQFKCNFKTCISTVILIIFATIGMTRVSTFIYFKF